MTRTEPPRYRSKTMRRSALPLLCALTLFAAGCETQPRPNEGGTVDASVESTPGHYHPETGEYVPPQTAVKAHVKNDENPKDPAQVHISPVGVTVNSGGSTPFEWDTAVSSQLFLIGAICVVGGLVLVGFGNHPFVSALTQGAAKEIGWLVAAGGVVLILLPYVGEGIKDAMPFILLAVGLIAVVVIARNRKKIAESFDGVMERISPEVEADLLADGDTRAAGAVRRVRTGSKAEAKMVASAPVLGTGPAEGGSG